MASSNNQIEEIKEKLDIVNVIEKYVKLRQAGKNYSGLCPFHSEKTPSFIVSPDLQRFKCFGCGETGDIYNFLQKIENIDFAEALEKLAKEAGIELKKAQTNTKYIILEDINYKATKYFYNQLKENDHALQYLKKRGYNNDSLKKFGVGYAPKYPKLKEYLLKSKVYTERQLVDSGLFTIKDKKINEKFYDRIMFPIRSQRGKVLAFTGRVLPGNDWGPKYMNSPDTPIFHKKENLFGQYESRQEIRKQDLVIVCEGSTDVISAHQHNIQNIVAPLGTGLTKEQLEKLSKLTKNFLFFFDSDQAGKNALIRAFKLASELKLNPYAATPEPYKDIDELLQQEPKKFKRLIKQQREAFFLILDDYLANKNLNKLEDIDKVRNFIGSLVFSVKDNDARDYYKTKASSITKIASVKPNNLNGSKKPVMYKNFVLRVKEADNKTYRVYIQHLLLLNSIQKRFLVNKEYITPTSLQKIYCAIYDNYKLKKDDLYTLLHDNPDLSDIFEDIIFNLTDVPMNKEGIEEQLDILINKIKSIYLKDKQKDLSVKIAMAEEAGKNKEAQKYLEQMREINKMLKD